MKNSLLLNFPAISQECDLPLNIHTDDLFGIFIRSYEEKENVIPSEANFHLLWNSHLSISENTFPSLDITHYSSGSRLMSVTV